jgi:hypothetical protein
MKKTKTMASKKIKQLPKETEDYDYTDEMCEFDVPRNKKE